MEAGSTMHEALDHLQNAVNHLGYAQVELAQGWEALRHSKVPMGERELVWGHVNRLRDTTRRVEVDRLAIMRSLGGAGA